MFFKVSSNDLPYFPIVGIALDKVIQLAEVVLHLVRGHIPKAPIHSFFNFDDSNLIGRPSVVKNVKVFMLKMVTFEGFFHSWIVILRFFLSAVSVGLVAGSPLLDLCYREDSAAEVDMNVVMNHRGEYVEIQGTGEGSVFTGSDLSGLLLLAAGGTLEIIEFQKEALGIEDGETAFS